MGQSLELNTIYCEDCLHTMDNRLTVDSVDMVLTSPPYDDMREYNGYAFDYKKTIVRLRRILKPGGVVVWVVGDQTNNGSETGTSFRHALWFMDWGFRLHDTMIYEKSGFANPSQGRYHQVFEYMFVFSKSKPKTFNPIKDRKNKYVGVCGGEKSFRDEYGMRFNVWRYANGGNQTSKDPEAFKHPAPFPEALAKDHIISWSNPGDLIYDPFMGSGTTAKMALQLGRNFVGSEVSQEYVNSAYRRINNES